MELKHKIYLRMNLVSLFFIVVSFISVTLAWFAYSGLASVETDIGVKAWYIELSKDNKAISNEVVISLADIYPGMETVDEIINIKNSGDSDAQVSYSIASARILGDDADNYLIDGDTVTSTKVEDVLSHDYPFHININLNKNFVVSGGDEGNFEVSISWPLDSDTDSLDSLWGNKAYNFQKDEEAKKLADTNYQIQSSIKIVISLKAEQYLDGDTSSDLNYPFGKQILYDVVSNTKCSEKSNTCLSTKVLDLNNKKNDTGVTLIPDVTNTMFQVGTFDNYNTVLSNMTSTWNVPTRALTINDLLNTVSTDVTGSMLVRDGMSDSIIGKLDYPDRLNKELDKAIRYNGYYRFNNQKFIYLASNVCIWTNSSYSTSKAFAIQKESDLASKVYGEDKSMNCNVIPVITALKSNLES